jgi:hypothetical protein
MAANLKMKLVCFGAMIFIQDAVDLPYSIPGLYTSQAIQVLQQVRVNKTIIYQSADDGTIFLNVRQGLLFADGETKAKLNQKGNQSGKEEKASESFTKFVGSCGFSAAEKNESWASTMKQALNWRCAPIMAMLLQAPWVRESFTVQWAKCGVNGRMDPVRYSIQNLLK